MAAVTSKKSNKKKDGQLSNRGSQRSRQVKSASKENAGNGCLYEVEDVVEVQRDAEGLKILLKWVGWVDPTWEPIEFAQELKGDLLLKMQSMKGALENRILKPVQRPTLAVPQQSQGLKRPVKNVSKESPRLKRPVKNDPKESISTFGNAERWGKKQNKIDVWRGADGQFPRTPEEREQFYKSLPGTPKRYEQLPNDQKVAFREWLADCRLELVGWDDDYPLRMLYEDMDVPGMRYTISYTDFVNHSCQPPLPTHVQACMNWLVGRIRFN